mgnify:FL=1
MIEKRYLTYPIETIKTIIKNGSTSEYIVSASVNDYKVINDGNTDGLVLNAVYSFEQIGAPMLLSEKKVSYPYPNTAPYIGTLPKFDPHYVMKVKYNDYDKNKNVIDYTSSDGLQKQIKYDKNNLLPKIIFNCPIGSNTNTDRIAFLNFEGSLTNEPNLTLYGPSGGTTTVTNSTSHNGYYSYTGTEADKIGIKGTSPGPYNVYIDIWVKNGGNLPIIQKKNSSNFYQDLSTPQLIKIENSWTLYRYTCNNTVPVYEIAINPNSNFIDDIKVYPIIIGFNDPVEPFHFKYYSYDGAGQLIVETDENDKSTYYEYDASGKLSLVRDNDKNIIKKYEYKFQQ